MNFTSRRFLLVRRGKNKSETHPSTGMILPNTALQRIAARWRRGINLNGLVWAARAEGGR